uniref:Uncharacterized protein n=1 Tax=Ditylenchus dipsaci TaxID=166011 RepID=A0A915CN71_9BILA
MYDSDSDRSLDEEEMFAMISEPATLRIECGRTANPARAKQLRLDANKCFEKGNFEEAVKLYSASLANHQTSVTFSNRAQAYLNLNKQKEALADARKAVKLDCDNLKAHFRMASAFANLGRDSEAIRQLQICMKFQDISEVNYKNFQQLYKEVKQDYLAVMEVPNWMTFFEFKLNLTKPEISVVGFDPPNSFMEIDAELQKCHTQIDKVIFEDSVFKQNVHKPFEKYDPICFTGCLLLDKMDISDMGKSTFEKLFSEYLSPRSLHLTKMKGLNGVFFCESLNNLSGLQNCVKISAEWCHDFEVIDVDQVITFLSNKCPFRRVFIVSFDHLGMTFDKLFEKFQQNLLNQKQPVNFTFRVSCKIKTDLPADGRFCNDSTQHVLTMTTERHKKFFNIKVVLIRQRVL